MTKDETTIKPEGGRPVLIVSLFELRISFELPHSDFVIVNHANAH